MAYRYDSKVMNIFQSCTVYLISAGDPWIHTLFSGKGKLEKAKRVHLNDLLKKRDWLLLQTQKWLFLSTVNRSFSTGL